MANIIKSLSKDSHLKDLSRDIIELVIDEGLKEGVIKEIPIVKTIYSLSKAYSSITDKIHLKKVLMVLLELKDIGAGEREKFIEDLKDKYSSGGEKLMLTINHLQTYQKCEVFGKLCVLKATNKIDLDTYLRLTKMIESAYLDDLCLMRRFVINKNHQYIESNDKMYIGDEEFLPLINLDLVYQLPSEPETIRKTRHGDDDFEGGNISFEYYFTLLGDELFRIFDQIFPEI